jgi:PPM family protein phosphatase
MTKSMRIAGQTDVGRARRDNQDTFISQPLWSANDALLVVIDGVGGYAGGAEAAALAKESIIQYMATPTGDTLTMLREAVVHANNQIVRQRQQEPALGRMCCVLTAAVADTALNKLLYVHVGDTRLYRFRQLELEKLTHDHSLVGVREDAHQLTEREAMHHPRRNEILRDIGSVTHRVDDPDFLESGETSFMPGDALLLCSDGLTDMLTRSEISDVLSQSLPIDQQIIELIRLANERGGQDNITIVMAQHPATLPITLAEAPKKQIRTTEPPPKNTLTTIEKSPQRTWKWVGLVLGVLVLLALYWQNLPSTGSSEPIRAADTVTADTVATSTQLIRSDTAGATNAPHQPDTTRKTR